MAPLEKISGLTPLMNMADEFCYEENRANAPLDMVNFATKKAGLTPLMNMADEFCYEESRANAPLNIIEIIYYEDYRATP